MSDISIKEETKHNKRAADNLFYEFERMIMSGKLANGDALPTEREIVEQFGVSRTVVREAILALSNKGLIDAKPRFRPVVKKPDFDTAFNTIGNVVTRLLEEENGLKNLFDTRIMIEVSLVRQAAIEAKREHMQRLQEALDTNEAGINDMDLFYKSDIQFHQVLYEIPGNPLLISIHKALIAWLRPNWAKMPVSAERNRVNFESHTAIYKAIAMRDPDQAEAVMRKHLQDAWDQVYKVLSVPI